MNTDRARFERDANDLYAELHRVLVPHSVSVYDRGDGTAVVHVYGWRNSVVYRVDRALSVLRRTEAGAGSSVLGGMAVQVAIENVRAWVIGA